MRTLVAAELPDLIPEIEALPPTLAEIEAAGLATVIPDGPRRPADHEPRRYPPPAAEELGLPTSPYAFASSLEELVAAARDVTGYPRFVKPVMKFLRQGQSHVETPIKIGAAWDCRLGGRGSGRVIVRGPYRLRFRDHPAHRAPQSAGWPDRHQLLRPRSAPPPGGAMRESWQPQPMTAPAPASAQAMAAEDGSPRRLRPLGVEMEERARDWFSGSQPLGRTIPGW